MGKLVRHHFRLSAIAGLGEILGWPPHGTPVDILARPGIWILYHLPTNALSVGTSLADGSMTVYFIASHSQTIFEVTLSDVKPLSAETHSRPVTTNTLHLLCAIL